MIGFAEIYDRIAGIFGGNTVVIGGRAVNLLCYNNQRNTHDIDVVIDPKSKPDEKVGMIQSSGFSIERDSNGRMKSLIDNRSGVSVDLYYRKEVGGIKIEDIIGTSVLKTESIGGHVYKFMVADPLVLILMKRAAWNSDRNERSGRMDSKDIMNLIQNQYGNPANFFRVEVDRLSEFFRSQDAFEMFQADIEFIFSGQLRR